MMGGVNGPVLLPVLPSGPAPTLPLPCRVLMLLNIHLTGMVCWATDRSRSRDGSPTYSEVDPVGDQKKSHSRRISAGLQLPDDMEPDLYLLSDPERLVKLKDLICFPLEVVARARPIYLDEEQGDSQCDDYTPHRPSFNQQVPSECGDQNHDFSHTATLPNPVFNLTPQQLAAIQSYREHMRGL